METIQKLVTKNLITVQIGEKMTRAADLMRRSRIRHLPVLDELGRLVGILSDRDVNRAIKTLNAGVTEGSYAFDDAHLVQHFMSWPVKAVSSQDTVGFVASQMIDEKISSFIVFDDASMAPTGIITTEDLLRYLLRLVDKESVPLDVSVRSVFEFLAVPTFE